VILAGGTGGAKLARGMLDVVGPEQLSVVANTGDDIEIYGAHVSPDPDLVSFWLADRIDGRGWGLDGDTFQVMDGLRELGEDIWFNLGDRDLAIGLQRAQALDRGERLTSAQARIAASLGVRAQVLPMSDQPVRTRVQAQDRWWPLQEYLICCEDRSVQDVDMRGARAARATPEVLRAIASAQAIVIGPSNPLISIGPILAVAGVREALKSAEAPIVAVSPIVSGMVLKGPTAEFLRWRDVPVSGAGIAEIYTGLLDGIVCDDAVDGLPSLRTDLLMDSQASRRRLAQDVLGFATGLGRTFEPTGRGRIGHSE
jgi:LPPG:FO 2-phospho-L-lactate transferase